jgi:hypothetical protein
MLQPVVILLVVVVYYFVDCTSREGRAHDGVDTAVEQSREAYQSGGQEAPTTRERQREVTMG